MKFLLQKRVVYCASAALLALLTAGSAPALYMRYVASNKLADIVSLVIAVVTAIFSVDYFRRFYVSRKEDRTVVDVKDVVGLLLFVALLIIVALEVFDCHRNGCM